MYLSYERSIKPCNSILVFFILVYFQFLLNKVQYPWVEEDLYSMNHRSNIMNEAISVCGNFITWHESVWVLPYMLLWYNLLGGLPHFNLLVETVLEFSQV